MFNFTKGFTLSVLIVALTSCAGTLPTSGTTPVNGNSTNNNSNETIMQTKLRGIEAADYATLFLETSDFPKDYEKTQNSQNDDKDPDDKKYAEFGGKRGGFNVWMTDDDAAAIWRIVDIRLVFPSAENAQKYINSSLGYLSEGIKEDKQAPKVGEDCFIFGPENPAGKAFGINMRSYTYVFRKNNVVVKFFVAEGSNSKTPLKADAVLPFAQKVLNRIS